MGTVTERLAILIDADAKGAVREFDQLGVKAGKSLATADDKLTRLSSGLTRFGTASVAAGSIAAVGIYSAVKAYEDAEVQSRKLDNSIRNSKSTFKENGAELRKLAQDIQGVTAADGDAIVGAQALLVQFGLTEDQVTSLTPLVVDLSRKMGIGLDQAAKVVGKSVDGSATALKKMGIVVDETKFKTDAFGATVDALGATVGGYAKAEGATFSGQMERLKNQLGDLQESVGKGALSVISGLVGGLSDLAGSSPAAADGVGNLAGKLGAIGSVGAVAVGALSLVAGQAIKLRDRFTTLEADGTRSLTRVGAAAKGLGIAFAAIGVYEAAAAITNEILDMDSKSRDALNRLTLAIKGTGDGIDDTLTEFGRLSEIESKTSKLSHVWTDFGADIKAAGIDQDVEDVQAAFDKLFKTDPGQATAVLDSLEKANQALDRNSDQYKTNKDFIDKNRESLDLQAKAGAGAGDAANDLSGELDGSTEAFKSNTDALKANQDALRAVTDPLFAVQDASDGVRDAQAKLAEVQKKHAENTPEYQAALRDVAKSGLDLNFALQTVNATLKDNPRAAHEAILAYRALRDQGIITQGQFDSLTTAAAQFVTAAQTVPTIDVNTSAAMSKLLTLAATARRVLTGFGTSWSFGSPDGKAVGGPVKANTPYLVGENGPELFTPGASGFITPNDKLGKASGVPGTWRTAEDGSSVRPGFYAKDRGEMIAGHTVLEWMNLEAAIKSTTLIQGHTADEWKNLEKSIKSTQLVAGHTVEEWSNLEKAMNVFGLIQGHTVAEWLNLEHALIAKGYKQAEDKSWVKPGFYGGTAGGEARIADAILATNPRVGGSSAPAPVVNVTVNTVSSDGVERAVLDALASANRKGLTSLTP